MKPIYVYTDFEFYGSEYPICFEDEEAKVIWKLCLRDRGYTEEEYPFDELFREATEEEIEDYGISPAELSYYLYL